jgi:hypothetical protein
MRRAFYAPSVLCVDRFMRRAFYALIVLCVDRLCVDRLCVDQSRKTASGQEENTEPGSVQ